MSVTKVMLPGLQHGGRRPRTTVAAMGFPMLAIVCGCVVQPGGNGDGVLRAEQQRTAFQSQCAQNVITCTRRFPTAVVTVQARSGQTVSATDSGFLIADSHATGSVRVQLVGSGSLPGEEATLLTYRWSSGATDDDPCTMTPGEEFSTQADPQVLLERGFHYIRLFVENDVMFPRIESAMCGVLGENIPGFHFVEVEIEVR